MSARIRDTDKQIENLMLQDLVSRIVGTLMLLVEKAGKNEDNSVTFDYSELQKDISSRLGLPIGKVMEVLEMLTRGRIASVKEGDFVIRDSEDLGKYMDYLELKERYSGV